MKEGSKFNLFDYFINYYYIITIIYLYLLFPLKKRGGEI